jgi:uncharacterized protein (TIGR02147 family)
MHELPRYQTLLEQEMLDRQRQNPKYSARAMARDLGLSPAFFSQLRTGKRALGDETAQIIARRLNWGPEKRKAFILLAQIERIKSDEIKTSLYSEYLKLQVEVQPREGMRRLKIDTFKLISDWYHFAIVESTELKQFKPDVEWIAHAFSISVERARSAVERLIRIGLISPDFKKLEDNYRIGDIPSEAIRNYHQQLLKLASSALESQPVDERDFSGCTIALDPASLPKARDLIRNFQKELMELVNTGEKTAVYQMSMQLFRLDHAEKK